MSVKYFNCLWQHWRKSYVYTRTCNCTSCVFLLLSFFLLFRTLYFNLIPVFFRDASMAYILFIGYMRLSMHLVLRILSNPRIYIVVLLYKSLSNPNISIGLYRLFFSLSRVDNQLCFINIRMCLFLCSAHIELGH